MLKNSIPSWKNESLKQKKNTQLKKLNLCQKKIEIFHTKVVTGVAEVQISNEGPGVCEFYVLYNNNNNKN
jgi:hypothetical protein